MKKIYLILMLVIMQSCSYGLVNPTYMKHKRCTTNYGAPILDTGLTTLGVVATAGLTFLTVMMSAFSTKPVSNSTYFIVGSSAAGTIYAGNSMAYGFEEVSKCRSLKKRQQKHEKR